MKPLGTIVFFLLFIESFGQPVPAYSCNQSTISPAYIIAPNFTTSISNSIAWPNDIAYLCGPNTVVYDTVTPHISYVIVDSGATFISNGYNTVFVSTYFIKNQGKLVLLPNSYFGWGFYIYAEPSAIIVNQSSFTLNIQPCISMPLPVINCATGINSYSTIEFSLRYKPNPVYNKLFIEATVDNASSSEIKIYNISDECIKSIPFSPEIDVAFLASGMYYIELNDGKRKTRARFIKSE